MPAPRPLKNALLIATLVIPAAIFVFLKLFGDNRFQIPVFYQQEAPLLSEDCPDVSLPYTVEDSRIPMEALPEGFSELITFYPSACEDCKELQNQLRRITEIFDTKPLRSVWLGEAPVVEGLLRVSADSARFLQQCVLFLPQGNTSVLLDAKRRIRGHYNLMDREEADRLIVEIKILLNEPPE
jgi:protein SCO1